MGPLMRIGLVTSLVLPAIGLNAGARAPSIRASS